MSKKSSMFVSRLDSLFSKACYEISQDLLVIDEPTKGQIKEVIREICGKYSLNRMPKSHEILSMVNGEDFSKLKKVLLKKPIKTGSGVAVIAFMHAHMEDALIVLEELNLIPQTAIQAKNHQHSMQLKMNMILNYKSQLKLKSLLHMAMTHPKWN